MLVFSLAHGVRAWCSSKEWPGKPTWNHDVKGHQCDVNGGFVRDVKQVSFSNEQMLNNDRIFMNTLISTIIFYVIYILLYYHVLYTLSIYINILYYIILLYKLSILSILEVHNGYTEEFHWGMAYREAESARYELRIGMVLAFGFDGFGEVFLVPNIFLIRYILTYCIMKYTVVMPITNIT